MKMVKIDFDDIGVEIKDLFEGFSEYMDVCLKVNDLCTDLEYDSFIPLMCGLISAYARKHDKDRTEILADVTISFLKGEIIRKKLDKDEKDEDA